MWFIERIYLLSKKSRTEFQRLEVFIQHVLCFTTGSMCGGNLVPVENKLVFIPSPSAGLDDILHYRALLVHLAQLRRGLVVSNSSTRKMINKRSEDHSGVPGVRKEDHRGFYGGHNPSGRIRILKF